MLRNFDPALHTRPVDARQEGNPNTQKTSGAAAPKATDEENQRVMQALQGEWLTVAEESAGKAVPSNEVTQRNRTIVIDGNSFTMTRVLNGTVGKYEGKFEIDAERGHFDWRGIGPRPKNVGLTGIYSLEGNTLKLCYRHSEDGGARPTEFKSDQTGAIFLTLKRQSEKPERQDGQATGAVVPKPKGTPRVAKIPQRRAETAGSQAFGLDQFRPEQCQVEKQGDGIRVTFRPSEKSGLIMRSPEAWNWSRFSNLSLDLHNPGKQPVSFLVRIDDEAPVPLSEMPTARGTLGAGESARFAVQLPLDGHVQGMKGLPTEPGARPLALSGLNMEHVIAFGIFLNHPHSPQDLVITGARLMPPVPLDGIVDRFGQYTRADWPGKLQHESEFRERLRSEGADLKAHPALTDRNRFGGSKTAKAPNTSGFFRTAKVGNKWWLVDPDGGLFFSAGVTSLHFGHGTIVADRAKLFTWLPDNSDPLSQHYRDRVHHTGPAINRRTFDFYGANLQRKYGPGYRDAWGASMLQRLPSWGFNTIGCWPDHGLFYRNGKVPYTATIDDILGDHGRIEGGLFGDKMHDAFDPAFPKHATESIRGIAALSKGDPWCVGYFVENELSVGGWGDDDQRDDLAYGTLAAPQGSHARAEFVRQLKSKYKQISKLNSVWGTSFADWTAFDGPVQLERPGPAARRADCLAFVKSLMLKYYEVVRDALKKEDPDHLYLGSRHGTWTPEAAEAAAEYCDVITFTIYRKTLDPKQSQQPTSVFNRLNKPCLIGEFSFGSLDRGSFHAGASADTPAIDQQHRGALLQGYVQSALDHPTVVGCHWYEAIDKPITGTVIDGANYNEGLLDVTDTPYPELIGAARDVLGKMYARRLGRNDK